MKQSVETYLTFLTKAIKLAISECEFPDKLRKSEVIPLCKKQYPLKKENYCPVSLFERILNAQINDYIENELSKYVTGFRKSQGTQYSLMIMLEKWKNVLEYVCMLFMDL